MYITVDRRFPIWTFVLVVYSIITSTRAVYIRYVQVSNPKINVNKNESCASNEIIKYDIQVHKTDSYTVIQVEEEDENGMYYV